MIGAFGKKIVFEVSDEKVFAFKKLTQNIQGRWAKHENLGGKPKQEFLGADTRSASLEIYLSANLGIRPRNVLNTLEEMVENGTGIEYLVIGNKPISKNRYALKSVSEE